MMSNCKCHIQPQGWLKPKAAAQYAGVSERTLRSWLKKGLRFSHLPSGSILIKLEWVDAFLEQFEEGTDQMAFVDKTVENLIKELTP